MKNCEIQTFKLNYNTTNTPLKSRFLITFWNFSDPLPRFNLKISIVFFFSSLLVRRKNPNKFRDHFRSTLNLIKIMRTYFALPCYVAPEKKNTPVLISLKNCWKREPRSRTRICVSFYFFFCAAVIQVSLF